VEAWEKSGKIGESYYMYFEYGREYLYDKRERK
jgi:hypothetical protein